MSLEKNMSRTIIRVLDVAKLDPVRVENRCGPGTPDIEYIGGWVENKAANGWPAKDGPLRVPHYTPQQRAWHRRRARAGGRVFVLLKVGQQEWLLFDGATAAKHLGLTNRAKLVKLARHHWPKGLNRKEFIKCLTESK